MDLPQPAVLPDRIHRLAELACDLWWSWNPEAREVFRRLDYTLWRETHHNPIGMLHLVSAERLEEVARDPSFLGLYDRSVEDLDRARSGADTWWSRRYSNLPDVSIAYFSAEFAVHQSLPLYAGGLGVLAGDHCKEASDLGVPLVGVGFRYPMGYFHQRVSAEGRQVEVYNRFHIEQTPLERARRPDGQPCTISVPLGHRSIHVAVWLLRLGRVKLYLLDTDVEENSPWERELSARLYVSEREARLRQEIVLGIGGVRALRALGHDPTVWHLNEGHAGFVIFERIRELVAAGESFVAALGKVRSTTLFTTHTSVAAGHDAFPIHLVDSQLAGFWEGAAQRRNTLLALAGDDHGGGRWFNMTALALRGSGAVNAVSQGHREVTRKMFAPMLAGWTQEEPVKVVTNGIHIPTWIAPAMDTLLRHHFGEDWKERQDDPSLWEGMLAIPDEELWEVRRLLKGHLLSFVRERMRARWAEGMSAGQVLAGGALLEPSTLTIGFARRFTEYKRPELIFHDPDRLARLLNDARRPVQLIFAGKAHPADEPGQRSLQRIYQSAANPKFAGRVAFVDDYDLHVAHFLVQGCDVWLNNPQESLEACGTSGMKASLNGVPHLSVADGWWSEGYTGSNGWLIERRECGGERAEAEALYRLLEEQVAPAFYERDAQGVPRRWMAIVKQAIRTVAPRFSSRGMVKQYVEQMYAPLAGRKLAPERDVPARICNNGRQRGMNNRDLPEYLDGLPNICGSEERIAEAVGRPGPIHLPESGIDFGRIRSAFAIALHMHQPLIPAGGSDLHTAAVISNLKYMMDNQHIGDNHNAPTFHWCYKRMGEFIPQLVHEGKGPRVMLDYSGCLLHGLRAMGLDDVFDNLKGITLDPEVRRSVEWLGTAWGHAVVPSTPAQDFRLHVRAWQHHFAAIFGREMLSRVKGFSPPEMAVPNHPDVCYEFLRTLKDCGYQWVLVQEHSVEQAEDGSGIRRPHIPQRLVARNSRGETLTITAIIKTQGSDTKLVGQMQPYYEARGLSRVSLAGKPVPQLVTQIADGENGGVMMNEFPPKYFQVMHEASGSETPPVNVTEYLEYLASLGIREEDFPTVQPILQKRIWERFREPAGPEALENVIDQLRKEDNRFHMEGGSWTNNLSWVRGYAHVLGPMERASALFAEKASNAPTSDPRFRNALYHLLMTQTSCFRYWGSGLWTDYARELCRRTTEILHYDF